MSNDLSERAMLASLNIRHWAATLTDKKITTEVAKRHGVKEKRAGKYRKFAIDVDSPSYKAIITAKSNIRNRFYELTLPWGQDGSRILTTAMHPKFVDEMRALGALYERAVEVFIEDYPALKTAAKVDLNGMYNEADYPDNIAAKFDCKWNFGPLPTDTDFRANLSAEVVDEIRSDIREELNTTTQEAMKEPYERLYAHIGRMVDRLTDQPVKRAGKGSKKKASGEPKAKRFTETLVSGLDELCSILPALNLTGDTRLDDLCAKAKKLIKGVDAETLRDVPAKRREVLKDAKAIQDTMAKFMGAPAVTEE